MSLRTKILAAIVGLNLVVLLLGVGLLLLRPDPAAASGRPAGIASRLSAVYMDPGERLEPRRAALRALEAARGMEAVVFLEDDASGKPQAKSFGGREPSARDLDRAKRMVTEGRRLQQWVEGEGEFATFLYGGVEATAGAPARLQGVYVRWSPALTRAERVSELYFVVLGGIVLMTAVAWWLLSRLVVRPLARLAGAADKVAIGDYSARLAAGGSGDEFDRTAQAFNRMAREVGEYQAQLEDRVLQTLQRVRKAEERLVIAQRLAATGKLASGIAHEINNPLGGMRNAVRALARGDLDAAKTAEYLDLVLDGLARVEDTVKKVLTFTPRSAKPCPVAMAEVVQKAIALSRHRIERKGIRFEARIEGNLSVRVFGDPHELQQVALNLLLNAADAIPEPGTPGRREGRIEVEVREEGDMVLLRVTDDGEGMTPEVQAQCFDLFFTTKEVGEGTGLGLAVVHNIITNHGGRIEVDSAPGKGTTFRVLLPKDAGSTEPVPAASR